MHVKIQYRKVVKKDLSQIIDLFKKVFKKKISKNYYNWRYKNNNFYNSFVALKNGKIIAHVGYVKYRFFKNQKIYSRHSSFVDKKFRGKKIYTNLLKFSFLKLQKKTSFILVWPNELNLKNNIKFKNFSLIQKYFLYKKMIKENQKIKTKKLSINLFKNIFKKNKNSLFIKDKKYIKWRFFTYKKENYLYLDMDIFKKKIAILQKNEYKKNVFYNIADYFENSKFLEKIISKLDDLKISYQFLIPSNDKKLKSKLLKYNFTKENYTFNVGIYILKQNDKLKKILVNKIKKNIKIADTDVFIKTF